MTSDSYSDETDHEWQYAGEIRDGRDKKWYTKWACPCGAYKLVSLEILEDDSGTYTPETDQS